MKNSITKYLVPVFILSVSCHSYKLIDKSYNATTLTPDATMFQGNKVLIDPPVSRVYYDDLSGITYSSANLTNTANTNLFISKPTIILLAGGDYLVYPGEHISVHLDKEAYSPTLFIAGNEQRNRELSFFNVVRDLAKHYAPFLQYPYSLEHILSCEKQLFTNIPDMTEDMNFIVDSIASAYNVSRRFKDIAKAYLAKSYLSTCWYLYSDVGVITVLKSKGIYLSEARKLLPEFKDIKSIYTIQGIKMPLTGFFEALISKHLYQIRTQQDVILALDSVKQNFNALAEDFLSTEILYTAIKKRIEIPEKCLKQYYSSCDPVYKKLIIKSIAQQNKAEKTALRKKDANPLLPVDGRKIISLDDVLHVNKGKLVLIDFWATWCVPCINELPFWENIKKQYQSNKITFLSLSLDGETLQWQKFLLSRRLDTKNSFILVNAKQSSFIKNYDIDTIPRYMLIGKDGKIIAANAPRPSDKALQTLIDEHL